jgi:hypothetical protein
MNIRNAVCQSVAVVTAERTADSGSDIAAAIAGRSSSDHSGIVGI